MVRRLPDKCRSMSVSENFVRKMSLDVDGQLEGPKNVAAVVIPVGAVGEMSSKWHFVVKSFLLVLVRHSPNRG